MRPPVRPACPYFSGRAAVPCCGGRLPSSGVRGYPRPVREAELWSRLESVLPDGYAAVWASQVVLADLGGRTVVEALQAGLPCKRVWRAAWRYLELPATLQ